MSIFDKFDKIKNSFISPSAHNTDSTTASTSHDSTLRAVISTDIAEMRSFYIMGKIGFSSACQAARKVIGNVSRLSNPQQQDFEHLRMAHRYLGCITYLESNNIFSSVSEALSFYEKGLPIIEDSDMAIIVFYPRVLSKMETLTGDIQYRKRAFSAYVEVYNECYASSARNYVNADDGDYKAMILQPLINEFIAGEICSQNLDVARRLNEELKNCDNYYFDSYQENLNFINSK